MMWKTNSLTISNNLCSVFDSLACLRLAYSTVFLFFFYLFFCTCSVFKVGNALIKKTFSFNLWPNFPIHTLDLDERITSCYCVLYFTHLSKCQVPLHVPLPCFPGSTRPSVDSEPAWQVLPWRRGRKANVNALISPYC